MLHVPSFVAGRWIAPDDTARPIEDAVTGQIFARAGGPFDPAEALHHARTVGGPALRAMTFHDRARMLKALALVLRAHRPALYELSYHSGGTLPDHRIDIDGGIGTMLVIASKGRREMPDGHVYIDGAPDQLGRDGQFLGQHICTPLQGVAVHINAFNFPVWGMLEKFAPTLLAGVPAIVKPATATSYVAEHAARIMLASGLLPDGALQLVSGGLGTLLDDLGAQDAVAFTGSADTALKLRANPNILRNSTRFTAEQDSLNASILGLDAAQDSPEFTLFISEAHQEMTAKAGQKCTATRRLIVPEHLIDAVANALSARLAQTIVGDPRDPATTMGALVSNAQKSDVLEKLGTLAGETTCLHGAAPIDTPGAFLAPTLLRCDAPDTATSVHAVEAFGPVSTLLPYRDSAHAAALANRGGGSLVASVFTHDTDIAREIALASAAHHGRLYFMGRTSAAEATGHGAPMPHMIHGGPGRAGGGEELGGIRGVMHYMQRTAIQGSPDVITAITSAFTAGSSHKHSEIHPFKRSFDALQIGETLTTKPRVITSDDIAQFAEFTGDTFYAHMDDAAAARNPFFPGRVAHGYLILSLAAGLFVSPEEGPVLANTGLDDLRFLKPVPPGDTIAVSLTVKHKTPRTDDYGEIRWAVVVTNQNAERVATYDLLTMVARASSA